MGIMCTANNLTLYFTQSKISFPCEFHNRKNIFIINSIDCSKGYLLLHSKESCEREMDKTVIISGYTGELKTLIHAI